MTFDGPSTSSTPASTSASTSKPSKKVIASAASATADDIDEKPIIDVKGKGKAVDQSSMTQGTFVVVAGSYEKLLYGLEGSLPSSSTTADDQDDSSTLSATLEPIFIFPAHLACVKAVAASPGGKWLATGSEDEFIKVWDLRRRREMGSLSQHTGMSMMPSRGYLRGTWKKVKICTSAKIFRINHLPALPFFLSLSIYLR